MDLNTFKWGFASCAVLLIGAMVLNEHYNPNFFRIEPGFNQTLEKAEDGNDRATKVALIASTLKTRQLWAEIDTSSQMREIKFDPLTQDVTEYEMKLDHLNRRNAELSDQYLKMAEQECVRISKSEDDALFCNLEVVLDSTSNQVSSNAD